jgi:anaerobic selenocysteine-containing dehydrogenase
MTFNDTTLRVSNAATTEMRRSICRVCHAACPIDVEVDTSGPTDRAIAIHGVKDDPLFEGYTCIKGRQLPDQIHHPARLRATLRRTPDGRFEECPTEEAFDDIAVRVRDIIERHGPSAVASYTGTGGYQSATGVAVARAWHQAIGSSSFYTSATIDQPAKSTAPSRIGVWEGGYQNFRDSDVNVAIGYNPMVSSYGAVGGLQGTNPFVVMREMKQRGMKLIVVDPRRTEMATFADIHLQVKPGEDPTLLAGWLNVVLSEGLYDHAFCERWVSDLPTIADTVGPFTPSYVAERCGIDQADFLAAVRMFAAGPRGTLGTGTGPNFAPHSSLSEHLAMAINIVSGRVLREGERVEAGFFLYPETPRRAQVASPPKDPRNGAPSRFRGLRGYRGEMPTATLAEEIVTPGEGQIRALFVSGGNPAVAWPDQELTLRALDDLELLVVLDHRMTPTAESATYVVPPRLCLERADVPHLMDRWFRAPYTNYTPAVLEASSEMISEWEMFWEVASRLGVDVQLPGGSLPNDYRPTDDDVLDLVYATARMSMDEVRANRGVIHEDKAIVVQPADPTNAARFELAHTDIVAELATVRAETTGTDSMPGTIGGDFPFRLVSRRLKMILNSLGVELPGLRAKSGSTNKAYMNPDDMEDLDLADDDLVAITSPRATLTGVAEADPTLRRGVVSMAHSWGGRSLTDEKVRDIGTPTNRLLSTSDGHDPITGMIVQSAIPVRLAKVHDHELV